MKRIFTIASLSLFFLVNPITTRAFDVGRLIDPACFFACDNDSKVINNTNNINSNINSPGSTVVTASTPNYTYNDNANSGSLGISCYPIYSTIDIGSTVIWRSSVYGGNGNYYISWTGTNGLSGNGSSISTSYNSPGTKSASVTVTSDGRSANANCSTVYVYDNSNNNDNNYDYNNNYSNDLDGKCYPTRSNVNIDDTVTWRASVYGGNGDYRITWSGTNGLSDTGSSASIHYRSEGTKYASIRVTSGNRTLTKNCSTVEVDNDNNRDYNDHYYDDYTSNYNYPLTISCRVSSTFATVGTRIVWESYVSGGNGRYSYEWRGTDNAYSSDRNLELFYNSPGPKTASVTVRSGGRNTTQTCSNSILIGIPISNYSNTTPSYTPPIKTIVKYIEVPKVSTSTSVESLFSLANIAWGWISFLIIIILFSTIVYLVFTKKN
jgi:hypothetical protein